MTFRTGSFAPVISPLQTLVPFRAQAGVTHQNGAASSNSIAVSFGSPVTNGSAVAVSFGFVNNGGSLIAITGVADDKGNTYTVEDSKLDTTNTYQWNTAQFTGVNNAPQTVTATISIAVTFGTIMADEFGNVASGGLDQHTTNDQNNPPTSTDGVTCGPVTPTTNGQLIYMSGVGTNSNGIATGTGFTQDQNVASTFATQHLVQASAAAITGTLTAGGTGGYLTGMMTFKHA